MVDTVSNPLHFSPRQVEKLEGELKALQQEISRLQDTVKAQQGALEQKHSEVQEAMRQVAARESEIDSLKRRVAEVEVEREVGEREGVRLREQIESMNTRLVHLGGRCAELEGGEGRMREEVRGLVERVREEEEEKGRLEGEVERLLREVSEVERERDSAEMRAGTAEYELRRMRESEAMREERAGHLTAEIDRMKEEVKQLKQASPVNAKQGKKSNSDYDSKRLQGEVDRMKAQVKKLEEGRRELEKKLGSRSEEIEEMKLKVRRAETQATMDADDLAAKDKQLISLEKERREILTNMKRLEGRCKELEREIETLKVVMAEDKRLVEELGERVWKLNNENDTLNTESLKKEVEIAMLKTQLGMPANDDY